MPNPRQRAKHLTLQPGREWRRDEKTVGKTCLKLALARVSADRAQLILNEISGWRTH